MHPGVIILSALLTIIGIAWFLFSYDRNKKSEVVEFLSGNTDFLLEKNIPMNPEKTIFSRYISNWNECDLFLFPYGVIIKGPKDPGGLHECAFLYFDTPSHPHIKSFRYYGKYRKPKISNDELSFYMLLYNNERYSENKGDIYLAFTLYPGSKTINLLKEKELL